MINEATIDKMLLMKFYGMTRAFKETMGTGVKAISRLMNFSVT